MKNFFYAALVIFLAGSCKTLTPEKSSHTLFTIDDYPVSNEEFLYVYQKNNFNDTLPLQESVDHYLQLFINFKLKVAEARALGMHNTPAFLEEFDTYKDQLTQPYLQDNQVTEQLISEAYERMQEEVNASHILIRVPSPAMPEDTLRAYNQLIELRNSALAGREDFETLARQHSQDPSAATNSGALGYFSALQMVYPFENAAFETPVDSISLPVRTRFGYHILKVNDRRKSRGQIRVAHILIRATDGIPAADSAMARQKIFHIYEQLQQGGEWQKLTRQYSEDLNSKENSGLLPWISTGNIHPDFAEAAFALNEAGEISQPVKTPYGWHIIRLEAKKGLEPLEKMEETLRNKIRRDQRSELNQAHLVKRLKKENNFRLTGAMPDILHVFDSSLIQGRWQVPQDTLNNPALFTIGEKAYYANDFYGYIEASQAPQQHISPQYYAGLLLDDYANQAVIDYEKEHLAEKYPDYRMLLREYEEGILLFQLMDEKVWSKASADTAGLQQFYQENIGRYQWNERAEVLLLQSADKQVLDEALPYLNMDYIPLPDKKYAIADTVNMELIAGKIIRDLKQDASYVAFIYADSADFEDIFRFLANRNIKGPRIIHAGTTGEYVQIKSQSKKALSLLFPEILVEEGLFEQESLPVLQMKEMQPGVSLFQDGSTYYYLNIKKIVEPQPKKLTEHRGRVISDYQDYLEKEWLKQLREKYQVEVNERAKKSVYQVLEKK